MIGERAEMSWWWLLEMARLGRDGEETDEGTAVGVKGLAGDVEGLVLVEDAAVR